MELDDEARYNELVTPAILAYQKAVHDFAYEVAVSGAGAADIMGSIFAGQCYAALRLLGLDHDEAVNGFGFTAVSARSYMDRRVEELRKERDDGA